MTTHVIVFQSDSSDFPYMVRAYNTKDALNKAWYNIWVWAEIQGNAEVLERTADTMTVRYESGAINYISKHSGIHVNLY